MAKAGQNDDVLLRQPIIILGSPRSGTTMMSRMLGQHPDVFMLIEPRLVWRYGNDRHSDLLLPQAASPKVIRHIKRCFAQQIRTSGKHRLVEKTPSNALRPAFVHQVFPDCKFVHIMRHPLDAVPGIYEFWQECSNGMYRVAKGRLRQRLGELRLSQVPYYMKEAVRRFTPRALRSVVGQNMWGPRLPGMQQMLRDLDLLDICCLQWRFCVENTAQYCRPLGPEHYFECKIEELTEMTVRNIIEFCALPASDAVVNYFTDRYDPLRVGARQRQLSGDFRKRISHWTEPTMRWLGYE